MDYQILIRKEGLRRGLSLRTIDTYCRCFDLFIKYCRKDAKKINKNDIKNFLDYLISKKSAGSTLNVYLNSIKFFYEQVLNKKLTLKIRFSKRPKTMPLFMTKEEVLKLIDNIENRKYKLIIRLIYSAGLRVSELVNLRARDLEIDKSYGWVRQGKGNKDRMFIIAEAVKQDLIDIVNEKENDDYLFEGRNGHLSTRSIQEIIKKAKRKAGIKKNIHPHTLRHSFATHLIENGYCVSSVQSLLGHSSLDTTMIYVHMTTPKMINVKSPLD